MMKYSLIALMLLALPVSAEVLTIEKKVEQDAAISVPQSGMSMDSVRAQFGDPQSVIDPVGDPPITRWVYPDFSVFFEYNKVIHSVMHHDQ